MKRPVLLLILAMCSSVYGTDFITKWTTTVADTTVTLPIYNGGTYDFTVDWGEGGGDQAVTTYNDADASHVYATAGTYTVTIKFGTLTGWKFFGNGTSAYITDVSQWGSVNLGNSGYYFCGCTNMTVTATDTLSLTGTTNLSYMFYNCDTMTTIDVNDWDVSSVTDLSYMFYDCDGLTSIDLDGWTPTAATSMYDIFYSCGALSTADVSNMVFSSACSLSEMFKSCGSLTTVTKTGLNIGTVTNLSSMFYGCSGLTSIDVNDCNVSSVTNLSYMFYNCTGLTSLDIDTWNITSVTTATNFLTGGSMTTDQYDALLISWSAQTTPKSNVTIAFGGSTYNTGAPTDARGVLTDTYTWTISDGGSTGNPYGGGAVALPQMIRIHLN